MTDDVDPLLQRLIEAHPRLFRGRAPVVPSYVLPGWYARIDKMCTDIEALLGPDACKDFEVRQIKEKFGSLRFYYRFRKRRDVHIDVMSPTGSQHLVIRSRKAKKGDVPSLEERLDALIEAACQASGSVCETCGAPGEMRNNRGFYVVLCDPHQAEKAAELAARDREEE